MKVVLFCGGLGTRLREYSDTIPKPMVNIGYRPIIWHVMKYYASYGIKDFVLCLGYRGDLIKDYFLKYDECLSNDFTLSKGGKEVKLISSDIHDWNITFVETGSRSNIGERLLAAKKYVDNDEVFLANYADGLTDARFDLMFDHFRKHNKIGCFLLVQPSQSFHVVEMADDLYVKDMHHISRSGLWINGGYFIFKKGIFDYIKPGEDLVSEPLNRLIKKKELLGYTHQGFWASMDTFKDKQMFDDFYNRGETPWAPRNNQSRTK